MQVVTNVYIKLANMGGCELTQEEARKRKSFQDRLFGFGTIDKCCSKRRWQLLLAVKPVCDRFI